MSSVGLILKVYIVAMLCLMLYSRKILQIGGRGDFVTTMLMLKVPAIFSLTQDALEDSLTLS